MRGVANKTYKCLNPVGLIDPVQQFPLSRRLGTIEGKNIFFSIGAGGEQDIIIPLRKKLVEKYPETNWHFYMAAPTRPSQVAAHCPKRT